MPLEARGKFYRREKSKGGIIYVPEPLVEDSQFFLENLDVVEIRLNPALKLITIRKVSKDE